MDAKHTALAILGPPSPSNPPQPALPGGEEGLEGGPTTLSSEDEVAVVSAGQSLQSQDPSEVLAAFRVLLELSQR